MMWLRSFLFGLLMFAMLAVMNIKVRSAWDVAGFVLGAAVFWLLVERILFSKKAPSKRPPGAKP